MLCWAERCLSHWSCWQVCAAQHSSIGWLPLLPIRAIVLFVNQLCTPLSNYHNLFHVGRTSHILCKHCTQIIFCSSEDGSCICMSIKNDRHWKFVHRCNREQVKTLHLCDPGSIRSLWYVLILNFFFLPLFLLWNIKIMCALRQKGFCFTKMYYAVIKLVLQ